MGNKELASSKSTNYRHTRSRSNQTNIISDSPFKTRGVFTRVYSMDESKDGELEKASVSSSKRVKEILSSPIQMNEEEKEIQKFFENSNRKNLHKTSFKNSPPQYKQIQPNSVRSERNKYFSNSASNDFSPTDNEKSNKNIALKSERKLPSGKNWIFNQRQRVYEKLLALDYRLFYKVLEFIFDEIPIIELVSSKFYVKINDTLDDSFTAIDNKFIKSYYNGFSFSKSGIKSMLLKSKGFRIDRIIEAEVLKEVVGKIFNYLLRSEFDL